MTPETAHASSGRVAMSAQFIPGDAINEQGLQAASGGVICLQNLSGLIPGQIRLTDAAAALTEPNNQRRDDGPALGCWWPA